MVYSHYRNAETVDETEICIYLTKMPRSEKYHFELKKSDFRERYTVEHLCNIFDTLKITIFLVRYPYKCKTT